MTETAAMTTGQYLQARRIRAHQPGSTVKYIALAVGATQAQVRAALDRVPHPRYRLKERPKLKKRRPSNAAENVGRMVAGICEHAGIRVPQEVIDAREQRLAVAHATITAAHMGDPLPGYSALDKRQG